MKLTFTIGDRFGRWTVTGAPVVKSRRQRYVPCVCECGRDQLVWSFSLKTGDSMGCRSCATAQRNTKHGLSKVAPEYGSWRKMRERCLSPSCHAFESYGAVGITVCERWSDFACFLSDMGPRPSANHSIDRIDNARGYEPGNCRWATAEQQSQNRRVVVNITSRGKTQCVAAWSRETGIKAATIAWRMRNGYSQDAALGDV